MCLPGSVNPLTGVETNGLTNSRLPGLLFWWKAARFLATSCVQDIHTYMYMSEICKYVQIFVYIDDKCALIYKPICSNCECFVTFNDQLQMRLGQTRALQANGLFRAQSQLNLAGFHEAGAVSL